MRVNVLRKRGGQAVVEMTFGFLIFFTIFMSIVEFSHLLYAKVTLQHALRSAGRYMVTGQTQKDGDGNDIPRDQIVHTVFCANVIAAGVVCPPLGADFKIECLPIPTACTRLGGGPNQTVMVTANVAKRALMPFFSQFYPAGGVPFTLSTTFKNEPFA